MSKLLCPVMMAIFHFMYLLGFVMKQKQIGKEWVRIGTQLITLERISYPILKKRFLGMYFTAFLRDFTGQYCEISSC